MSCARQDRCKHGDGCFVASDYNVKRCTAFKSKVQTNEEWFCGLSTEEKATFLAIQIRLGVEFYRTNDERYQNHDWWVEWLKQPHTPKE